MSNGDLAIGGFGGMWLVWGYGYGFRSVVPVESPTPGQRKGYRRVGILALLMGVATIAWPFLRKADASGSLNPLAYFGFMALCGLISFLSIESQSPAAASGSFRRWLVQPGVRRVIKVIEWILSIGLFLLFLSWFYRSN